MLGRSARERHPTAAHKATTAEFPRTKSAGGRHPADRTDKARMTRSNHAYRHYPKLPCHSRGSPQQAKKAIAERNAAEREQVQFTIQNAKFTINGFSSKVRFHCCHSEAEPKNLLIGSIYSSCARPGRLRGSRFQREPAPGARSSVSERDQILRDMLAIIVILSGANRRTQRVQRPLADYVEQGGERQT